MILKSFSKIRAQNQVSFTCVFNKGWILTNFSLKIKSMNSKEKKQKQKQKNKTKQKILLTQNTISVQVLLASVFSLKFYSKIPLRKLKGFEHTHTHTHKSGHSQVILVFKSIKPWNRDEISLIGFSNDDQIICIVFSEGQNQNELIVMCLIRSSVDQCSLKRGTSLPT